jgi:hypothetical protein
MHSLILSKESLLLIDSISISVMLKKLNFKIYLLKNCRRKLIEFY